MVGHTLRILVLLVLFMPVALGQPLAPTREAQDFTVAYGLYKDGQFQLAFDELQRFIDRYPSSTRKAEAEFLSAESLVRLGQNAEASDRFERFLQDYPGSQLSQEARFRTGELALGAGRSQEAIKRFAPLIAEGGGGIAGEACYWTGEAYSKLGKQDSALAYYQRAIAKDPSGRLADYAAYSIGWVYQQQGDFAKALPAYEEVTKRFPRSPLRSAAQVRQGEVLMQSREEGKAIALLQGILPGLEEADDRAEALYLLGESHYHKNRFPQARAWYDSFLTHHRGHRLERDVLSARAWTLLQEQRADEAAAAFIDLAAGEDAIAHASAYRAGVALKLARKPAQAETWFKRVASTANDEFADDALYEIGVLRFEQGAHDSALAVFNKVLSTYPTGDVRAKTLFMVGEVHRTRGALDAALASYRDARAQDTVSPQLLADLLYEEGLTLEQLGRYAEASSILRAFVSEYPGDTQAPEAWFWLGEAYFHDGAYERADSAYTVALQKLPPKRIPDALYGKAWSRYRLEDFKGARDIFSRIVSQHPKSTYADDSRLRVGDCHTSLREHAKAVASYREVLKLGKPADNLDYARYQLGGALIRNGQPTQGIKEYETLLARTPDSPYADDARYAIGWVYFQQKNYPRAMKEFRETLRLYPKSELVPRVLCSLGDAHYNSGDYPGAIAAYEKVLAAHPQSSSVLDAAKGVRDAYAAQNKESAGEARVTEFLRNHPTAAAADRLALQKAEEKFAQGEYEAARGLYADFLRVYPKSPLVPDASIGAGRAHLALGHLQEAEGIFRSTAERFPGKPAAAAALYELGKLLARQLRPTEAMAMFERVEAEHPGSPEAGESRLERARTLRDEGDASGAVLLLETITPETFSDALADRARVEAAGIHLQKKRYDQASALYTAVAQSRSDDIGAEAQCGAAEVLFARGDVDGGVAAFARVKYLYPGSREWIGKASFRMADGYILLGQQQKARDLYATVASEHKGTTLGLDAAAKLEGLR
ncbi:MAG: tetratricopeptide repeat protein [Bacteroidetes bacterium]|nr:tetratricopeptide repeat protein [Bacteroidota bacterium]